MTLTFEIIKQIVISAEEAVGDRGIIGAAADGVADMVDTADTDMTMDPRLALVMDSLVVVAIKNDSNLIDIRPTVFLLFEIPFIIYSYKVLTVNRTAQTVYQPLLYRVVETA